MSTDEDTRQRLQVHKKRALQRERENKLIALDQVINSMPIKDICELLSDIRLYDKDMNVNGNDTSESSFTDDNEKHVANMFRSIPPLSDVLRLYYERTNSTYESALAHRNGLKTSQLGTDVHLRSTVSNKMNDEMINLFWDFIPEPCRPTSNLDCNTASEMIILGEQARQSKFERKLAKQLQVGSIIQDQYDKRLREYSRRQNNGKELLLLSPDRARRKQQQIENFTSIMITFLQEKNLLSETFMSGMQNGCHAVLSKTEENTQEQQQPFVIVDFGCGTGNLCLVLAAFFSSLIHIVFVDMKSKSLELLQNRALLGKLTNTQVVCLKLTCDNLHTIVDEGIIPPFDLGIGLHCCGSFTDIVIQLCAQQGASCIVCPCCNGKMTSDSTNGLCYPRSELLKKHVSQENYLNVLSRQADSIEKNVEANYYAKCLVELDRALHGVENKTSSYERICDKDLHLGNSVDSQSSPCEDIRITKMFKSVELLKLDPIDCSPKHHVLFFKN